MDFPACFDLSWNDPTMIKKAVNVTTCSTNPPIKTPVPVSFCDPSQSPEEAMPLPEAWVRQLMTSNETKILGSHRRRILMKRDFVDLSLVFP
jgi:hypothetical protein